MQFVGFSVSKFCLSFFFDFQIDTVIDSKESITKRDIEVNDNVQIHHEVQEVNHIQIRRHIAKEPTTNTGTLRDPLKIDDRIRRIQDSRPKDCISMSYSISEKVSIIITFFDYQLYDLKATIDSVRLHTPDELIQEIIMVDDGSTLDYIKDDAKLYSDKVQKSRLLRLESREGTAFISNSCNTMG